MKSIIKTVFLLLCTCACAASVYAAEPAAGLQNETGQNTWQAVLGGEAVSAGHAFKMVFRYRPKLCICGIFCRKKTVAVQPRRHFALANRSQRKHCKRSFARPRRQRFCCRQKFGKLLRFERKTQMDHRTACRKRFAAYSDERRQHTVHSLFYQKRSEHGHTHIALRRTD